MKHNLMGKDEIIQFITEKILDIGLEEGKKQYNIRNRKRQLKIYMTKLEQELLCKYNDSVLYDELFRILTKEDFINKLLLFCQDQNSQRESMTFEQMIQEGLDDCDADTYMRSQIKTILQQIAQDAFAYFNDITDEDAFNLKNYLERQGREIRHELNDQKKIQREILSAVQKNAHDHPKAPREITFGPPKPVAHFLGREDEIKDLMEIAERHLNSNERLACWIHGMGGLGKTQLCRMLYLKLRNCFKYIGWIAYQGEDFRTSLVEALHLPDENSIGKTLEDRYQEALKYLQSLNTEALLFIDNYDNIEDCRADIERLSCHVIISSRSKNPDMFQGYSLGFLPLGKCKQIFERFYHFEEADEGILNEIIHLAGYLTIAVELLAKTARKQNLTLLEFYEILQKKSFDIHTVIQSNWDNNGDELQKELTRHFEIIFDITSIRQDKEKVKILQNFCVLPYLSVAYKEIVDWLTLDQENNFLSDLHDSGWLEQSDDYEYSMHPLISYTMKKNMPPQLTDCLSMIKSLTNRIHADSEHDYLEIFTYLPYADAVGKYFRTWTSGTDGSLCKLFCELASAYAINGEYQIAYRWGEDAVCRMAQLNDVDVEFPNMLYNIMSEICLDMRNRNQECKQWAEKAVKYDRKHKRDVPGILRSNSFHNLGSAYIQLKDNDRAIKWEEKALRLRRKSLPEYHVKVMNTMRNLAMVYRRNGNIQEAFEIQREVVRNLLRLHQNNLNHPDFPVAYNIYSFILRDLNNLQGAICYQNAAVRIREHNNVNDPKLAINYNNLGVFLRQSGDLKQSDFYHRKAIATDLRLRGSDHIDLATDYYNYALTLYEMKQYAKALSCLDEAIRIETLANVDDLSDMEALKDKIIYAQSY